MSFTGFTKEDFDVFLIDGLDARMEAIQERIRPKFNTIGQVLCDDLALLLGEEMYLHIAKHARRTVNPPKDTWLALCNNKRGYKQHPHFQVGLFDDHVFVWLAFIYELPNKKEIAENFLNNIKEIQKIVPNDYVISFDHMKKDAVSVSEFNEEDWKMTLDRFRDVRKAEFLVGRHISANEQVLKNGDKFIDLTSDTFHKLIPLYKLAYE